MSAACSNCHGGGHGLDGKPCACGCLYASVPAAIAPPVAAGSVDTLQRYELGTSWGETVMEDCTSGDWVRYDDAIAWGAQQREAGRREMFAEVKEENAILAAKVEKAEARVKELQAELDIELERAYDRLLAARAAKQARRQALQAEGKHPAPCARHCEANAFQIEVRRLEAVELDLHRKLAAEKLRADQGWARWEAANRAKNDLEKKLADATPYALKA